MNDFKRRTEKVCEQKLFLNDFQRRTEKVCERKLFLNNFQKSEQNRYLNGNYFWTILKGEQKKSVNGNYFWTIFKNKNRYLNRNYFWTKIGIWPSKQKSYYLKVVWNVDINLLVKGYFKRSTECDEFDKNCLKRFRISIQNWEVAIDETRNWVQEWNLCVDAHKFRVHFNLNSNIFLCKYMFQKYYVHVNQ